jgi:hypothetical protein
LTAVEVRPHLAANRPGRGVFMIVAAGWSVVLCLVLSHSIFVTNDSLNNYAHVAYISDRLWSAHEIPLNMPVLAHGEGFAFPYAFIPWLTAAVVRPLLGDWTVTLWLVVGFLGLIFAMRLALPELRGPVVWALLLLNPVMIEAVLLGQLPFVWASALLFLALACHRRNLRLASVVLLGAAQATHPPIMLPLVLVSVALIAYRSRDGKRLLVDYAASMVIASPAIVMVFVSPAIEDSGIVSAAANLLGTLASRSGLFLLPALLLFLQRSTRWRPQPTLVIAFVVINIAVIPLRSDAYAWRALVRYPARSPDFLVMSDVEPGRTYRILRAGDGKLTMYRGLDAGAVLDSEFFPETIRRRSWHSYADYEAFLRKRRVDYVLIYESYDKRFRTNEHFLLESQALTGFGLGGTRISITARTPEYDLYRVDRAGASFGESDGLEPVEHGR